MNSIIVAEYDPDTFYRSVSAHLSLGWRCIGMPIIDGSKIQQELILIESIYHDDPAIDQLLKNRDRYGWNY